MADANEKGSAMKITLPLVISFALCVLAIVLAGVGEGNRRLYLGAGIALAISGFFLFWAYIAHQSNKKG